MLKLNKDVVKELFPNIEEKKFKLTTEMRPSGDQINAIKEHKGKHTYHGSPYGVKP